MQNIPIDILPQIGKFLPIRDFYFLGLVDDNDNGEILLTRD